MSHFSDFAVWWWWSSGIWRRNTPNFCLLVSTTAAEARRRQLKNSPDLIAFRGNRVRDGAKCQLLSRKISLLNQSLKFQMVLGFWQSYTSQVLWTLERKLFSKAIWALGQLKMGWFLRLACSSSKTKNLKNIIIYIWILNLLRMYFKKVGKWNK